MNRDFSLTKVSIFSNFYIDRADIKGVGSEQIIENFSAGSLVAGRFRIVRHIATGSMGSVYLALDRKLGDTQIALKLLHSKFLADQIAFKRFSNEVVFARKLTHPNIVKIYDFEETSTGQKLISMEFIQGVTLGDLFKELHGDVSFVDNPFTNLYEVDFQRVLKIFKKILSGVACAHKAGILHRDLKPFNILLDEFDEPKIGDFGLATIAGVSSGLTSDGNSLMGTPDYMAPEQVLGQRMTARSDIYSLGIIAFELLYGRVPFIAESPLAVAYMQVQAPFPNMAHLPPFVPNSFIRLIKRATNKNPHERFSSVDEMIEALSTDRTPGEIRLNTQPGNVGFGGRPLSKSASKGIKKFTPNTEPEAQERSLLFKIGALLLALSLGCVTFISTSLLLEYDRRLIELEQPKMFEKIQEAVPKKNTAATRKKSSSKTQPDLKSTP